METIKICPNCRKPLPPDVPLGLCPECLIKAGFPTGTEPGAAAEAAGARFVPPPVAEIAQLFPQLEVLRLIGQGGMGAVYKARQPTLDRFVALKVLPPAVASDPGFAERFNREARALARLNHPNIVAVHDFGKAGPLHYLLMEFVDGANLREVEQAGELTSEQALAIVPQICEALQFAHNEGVVHRDIKPENLLLDKKGRVKITDFGIAKIIGQSPKDVSLTGAKDIVGTPHYMAPEQLEKPLTVDHRADIYSLGVVFYEMLTGELPLGKFQPPSAKVQIDVRLDEVVLHALEKEPARRYQQVSEVKTQMEIIANTSAPAETPTISVEEILARDYTLNIRHCLRRGWALVRNDFWPLVGMSALVLVVLTTASSFELVWSSGISSGIPSGKTSILGLLLKGPLMGGLYLYFLKKIRREAAGVETAFTGFRQPFPHLVIACLLATVLTVLGFLCLILPGIYLFVAWQFIFPLIIDQRLDFWPAMQLSRKVISKHWWKFFGFLIVLALTNMAGFLVFFVGIFITFPVTLGALMYAYEDIIGAAKIPSGTSSSVPLFATPVPPVVPPVGLSAKAGTVPPASPIQPGQATSGKIILPAFLMAFFFGGFGAHRFYVGKTRTAILQLAVFVWCVLLIIGCATTGGDWQPTLGILLGFSIFGSICWTTIDWILILCKAFTDGQGRRITHWFHPQTGELQTAGTTPQPARPGSGWKPVAVIAATAVIAGLIIVIGLLIALPVALHHRAGGNPKEAMPPPVRIKAGLSRPFTDSAGNVWLADQGFSGGDTSERFKDLPITNTQDPVLYRSERYGMTSFSYPVPNGKYVVKLLFAETFDGVTGPGERVFSFNVQGQEFKEFDVWAKAGGARRAYVETVNVEVTDGKLDIHFTPQQESPEINGIEILPVTPNTTGTAGGPSAQPETIIANLSTTDPFQEDFNQTLALSANGRLRLDNVNGRVEIIGWDRSDVVIKALKHGKNQDYVEAAKINVVSSRDEIAIHTEQPSSESGFSAIWSWLKSGGNQNAFVDYAIQVPRHTRLANISSVNGKIAIAGVAGNIEASTVNGETQVKDAAGDLKLSTVNGRIEAELVSLEPGQSVSFSGVNGQIEATLPADANADVSASTVSGGITSGFPALTVQKEFPVGSKLNGTLGRGGARVKINTVNGRISIQPGKPASPAPPVSIPNPEAEKSALEKVTFALEKDGQWKSAGYYIK